MKNLRKILSLVLVAMMLISIAVIPASAAIKEPDAEIQWYACECGDRYYKIGSHKTNWASAREVPCTHHNAYMDTKWTRSVFDDYACKSCPNEMSKFVKYEYKVLCSYDGNVYYS